MQREWTYPEESNNETKQGEEPSFYQILRQDISSLREKVDQQLQEMQPILWNGENNTANVNGTEREHDIPPIVSTTQREDTTDDSVSLPLPGLRPKPARTIQATKSTTHNDSIVVDSIISSKASHSSTTTTDDEYYQHKSAPSWQTRLPPPTRRFRQKPLSPRQRRWLRNKQNSKTHATVVSASDPGALREQASPTRRQARVQHSTPPKQQVVVSSVPQPDTSTSKMDTMSMSSRGGRSSKYTTRTTTSMNTQRVTNLTNTKRNRRGGEGTYEHPIVPLEEAEPTSEVIDEDPYQLGPLVENVLATTKDNQWASHDEDEDNRDMIAALRSSGSSYPFTAGYDEEVEAVYSPTEEPRYSLLQMVSPNSSTVDLPSPRGDEEPYNLSGNDNEDSGSGEHNDEEKYNLLSDNDSEMPGLQYKESGGLNSPSYQAAVDAHEQAFVEDIARESVSDRTPIEEGEEVIMVETTTSTEESEKREATRETEGALVHDDLGDIEESVIDTNPLEEAATVSDMGSPTASIEETENEKKEATRSTTGTTSILMNSTRQNKTRRRFFPDDEDDDQTKEASVISRKSSVSWADEVLQKHTSSSSQYEPTPNAIRQAVSGLTMTPTPSFAGYIEDKIDMMNEKKGYNLGSSAVSSAKKLDHDKIAELCMSQQESVEAYLENKIDYMNNKALAESIQRSRGTMSSKLEALKTGQTNERSDDPSIESRADLHNSSLNLQLGKLEPGDERRAALDLAWKKMMERRDAPSLHSGKRPDPTSYAETPLISYDDSDPSTAHSKPPTIHIPAAPYPQDEQHGYLYSEEKKDEKDTFPHPIVVRRIQTPTSTYSNGHNSIVRLEQVSEKTIKDPYGDYGSYTGILIREKPHGQGSMNYADGRFYIGQWKSGRWNGHGRVKYANGDIYSGQWKMDKRHGVGRYEWKDGRVYDGEFKNDHREGRGTFTFPDGSVYTGEFRSGQRHGQGCYKFHDAAIYNGEFKNGKYDGIGECIWAEGRCYLGEWVAGQAHGYGVEIRADGTVRHDGEWRHDRPVRNKKLSKRSGDGRYKGKRSPTPERGSQSNSSRDTSTKFKGRRAPTPERLRSRSNDDSKEKDKETRNMPTSTDRFPACSKDESEDRTRKSSDMSKYREWGYPSPERLRIPSVEESLDDSNAALQSTKKTEKKSSSTKRVSKYAVSSEEPMWSARIKAKKEAVKNDKSTSAQKMLIRE